MALSRFEREVLLENTLPGLKGGKMPVHLVVHDQSIADEIAALRGRHRLPRLHFRIAGPDEPRAWGR